MGSIKDGCTEMSIDNVIMMDKINDKKKVAVERATKWNTTHKERREEIRCTYRKTHKVELFEKSVEYSKNNRDRINKTKRTWYSKNKEKAITSSKKWQQNNPEKVKILSHQTIKFKGVTVNLDHVPRVGICSDCNRSVKNGEIERTNMHHKKYDAFDPLKYTVELCVRCHLKLHARLRRMK